jgi:predicted RNA-binding protein YlqC (UPF0109 family)
MEQGDMVERLLLRVVRSLVDTPKNVAVECLSGNGGTTYRIQVADAEVGQVIGKQGRIARSLRTIVAAVAMKEKRRITLDIERHHEG